MPISELSLLGASVASLVPALRTVTSTYGGGEELYTIVNKGIGDTLQLAKDGNSWASLKTTEGSKKMVKLSKVNPTTKSITPVDPTTMMMAVALYSIEQQLARIESMQKEILSFLEAENESEIEADVETLTSIISKYKHNWDNDKFMSSNHKLVLDIQRTARKNINFYQKKISSELEKDKKFFFQSNVKSSLNDLTNKFQYYRLSLYTFSLASLVEVLLGRNFNENNIQESIDEVTILSSDYRKCFSKCSLYLEESNNKSLDQLMMKGIGAIGSETGKLASKIKFTKETKIESFFRDGGDKINDNIETTEKNIMFEFSKNSDPFTAIFVDKMTDMIEIYSEEKILYFDEDNLYILEQ